MDNVTTAGPAPITVFANDRQRMFLLVHVIQQPSPDQADRDAKRHLLAAFGLDDEADNLAFKAGGAAGAGLERERWASTALTPYLLTPQDAATLERVLAVNVPGAFGYQLGVLGTALASARQIASGAAPP